AGAVVFDGEPICACRFGGGSRGHVGCGRGHASARSTAGSFRSGCGSGARHGGREGACRRLAPLSRTGDAAGRAWTTPQLSAGRFGGTIDETGVAATASRFLRAAPV